MLLVSLVTTQAKVTTFSVTNAAVIMEPEYRKCRKMSQKGALVFTTSYHNRL